LGLEGGGVDFCAEPCYATPMTETTCRTKMSTITVDGDRYFSSSDIYKWLTIVAEDYERRIATYGHEAEHAAAAAATRAIRNSLEGMK
jgi:hypothetical protein